MNFGQGVGGYTIQSIAILLINIGVVLANLYNVPRSVLSSICTHIHILQMRKLRDLEKTCS